MHDFISLAPSVQCIGVASSVGAPGLGSEHGSSALRAAGLVNALRHKGLQASWRATLASGKGDRMTVLHRLLLALAQETEDCLMEGAKPIILGGDHAQAAGTWRGIGRALGYAPGLIWIDAHLDAHTPASSPSGNPHGMPLAALLGYGAPAMTDIPGPRLDPRRLAIIGVRSFEAAEADFLDWLGVRIFPIEEVRARGLGDVYAEARQVVAPHGEPYGISLDLDAIDPRDAPGVSVPATGGIAAGQLLPVIRGCLRERECIAVELTEYSPRHDIQERTARLAIELLETAAALPAGPNNIGVPTAPSRMKYQGGENLYGTYPSKR